MRRFKVLETDWEPRKVNPKGLGAAMRRLLDKHGIKLGPYSIEIRGPAYNRWVARQSPQWHQDIGGRAKLIILWANKAPTELRAVNSKLKIKVRPKEVIIFHNQDFQHRIPSKCKTLHRRWFVRHIVRCGDVPRNLFK